MSVAHDTRKRRPPVPLTTEERLRGAQLHLGDALRLLVGAECGYSIVAVRVEIRRLRDVIDDALAERRPAKRRRA